MSYIDEINKFHRYLRTSDLPPSARLLWFVLMDVANSTGWKPTFNVSMSTLVAGTGLSPTSIKRARKELRKAGLIQVQSRRGRQSSVYQVISLAGQFAGQYGPQKEFVDRVVGQIGPQCGPQNDEIDRVVGQIGPQCGPIHREDKTIYRQDETKTTTAVADTEYQELVKLFSKNVHPITPIEAQKLEADLSDYGDTWVKAAIEEAVLNGVPKMSYIEGILKGWKAKGSMTRGQKKEPEREIIHYVDF